MRYFGYALSIVSSLIPVAAGIYYFKKLSAGRKLILYFFLITAFADFINGWLGFHHINNQWEVNIYTVIEFSFYVLILSSWVKARTVHRLSLIAAAFFYAAWIYCVLSAKTLGADTFPAEIIKSIVIMLLSAYVLGTLSIATEYPVLKNYKFWFAGVSFIYNSIGILLNYIFESLIANDPAYDWGLWNINTAVNIAANILF